MHQLLEILWALKGLIFILVGVMALARGVKLWRKARRSMCLVGALLLLGRTAEAADSCAGLCDSSIEHCSEVYTVGVASYECIAGAEPWFSADQAAQGSLRGQWILAMCGGLLLFVCFSTRFKT